VIPTTETVGILHRTPVVEAGIHPPVALGSRLERGSRPEQHLAVLVDTLDSLQADLVEGSRQMVGSRRAVTFDSDGEHADAGRHKPAADHTGSRLVPDIPVGNSC